MTDRPRDRLDAIRIYALLAAMPLFFSSNVVIGRAAANLVDPASLAFWRWFIAFLILLPIAWTGLREHRAALRQEAPALLVLAFLGMVICGAVVYIGLGYTTATNAALIYATTPVLVIGIEWIFSGQRVGPGQVLGILSALSGVLIIIFRGRPEAVLDLDLNAGDLCIAAGALSWAVYTIILKRPRLRRLPTIPVMAATTFLGAVLLAPFALWETLEAGGLPASLAAWSSILGVALVASILAFSSYQKGVQLVGPGRTSLFMYLMPVYAASLAALLLGETIGWYHVLGAGLIIGGVALATGIARHIGLSAQTQA